MVAMEKFGMGSKCNNNDPWVPLPEEGSASSQQVIAPAVIAPAIIAPAPQNPLSKMIESEHYIQTLERKLAQLTKVKKGEPSSRDIITSLALFHDDQMRRYISQTEIVDLGLTSCSRSDEAVPQTSFVQRKLHPEKQPLNAEEIAELVKEDVLAKVFEETVSSSSTETVLASLDTQSQSSHVPEPSETAADLDCTSTVNGTHEQNGQDVEPTALRESPGENWANFDELV